MSAEERRARVLVVDDSRFHRELARDVLSSRAEVTCCSGAQEALAALEHGEFDLVISDLTMPELSGLDLLERVQRRFPGSEFVIVTANATVDSAVHALRMGATDYLQKPVRSADLILCLERALARRRLVSENQRLRGELALYAAARTLASTLEPDEVFALALEIACRTLANRRGFALYQRPNLTDSIGVHAAGLEETELERLRAVIEAGKRVDWNAYPAIARVDRGPLLELLRAAGIAEAPVVVVPLRGEEQDAGLLALLGAEDSPDALAQLAIVAAHAGVALRNAERYRRARDRAFVDDATDVYNSRYLLEALDREVRRSERYGSELSILFIDLDRFKLVNDNHGHLVGTSVLRQLSRLLAQSVRQVDTVARYGGDEFTILLADTGERGARVIAERIRKWVADNAFEADAGRTLKLSCSVGLATYPAHGRTREALLDAADKAMYRAKSQGRNRVCSASELA
ncbi:MAG: diguanylate cyclase [Deltaproteobacteria bacterium]|nr:diguanylate cyclase [Deltaproteobacteria bacterium]